ncbi:MAG TPA: hypothetical protein ENI60_03890 [Candidatus Fraserbacteria bacterium]|nr:hypothetical protein [Candidatus Fraserbacteria bacterium]
MLKRTVLALALVLVLAFGGLAQSDKQTAQRETLQKLLLTQDEIVSILGSGWSLQTTGDLAKEPNGAISAAAVYQKPGEQRGQVSQVTDALLEFADVQTASAFFSDKLLQDLFTSPVVPKANDPQLAKIKEQLGVGGRDNKGADNATFATLQETDERLIAFVKDQRISFVRGNLSLDDLLKLAKKQLDILVNGRPSA